MNNWLIFDQDRFDLVGQWSISTRLLSLLDVVAVEDEDGNVEFLKNRFTTEKNLAKDAWEEYKYKFGRVAQ